MSDGRIPGISIKIRENLKVMDLLCAETIWHFLFLWIGVKSKQLPQELVVVVVVVLISLPGSKTSKIG